jgi:xanthine phosphoribosyltransferase
MATRYLTISWSRLHADTALLAERLRAAGPFAGIVAVARGGLVPAAIVARILGCRHIETISIASYEEEQRGAPVLLKPPSAAGDGTGYVVIDDLVDSGQTARLVRALLPRAHFAAVYAKPDGRDAADTVAVETPQDTWIVFPWDPPPKDAD